MRKHAARVTPSLAICADRVGEERVPVAVAPVDRDVDPGAGEVLAQRREERAVLVVDRRAAAEQEVVLADLLQPLARDPPAAGHVLQERHDVLGPLGAAERHEQQCVVRRDVGNHGLIVLSDKDWLTVASRSYAHGVDAFVVPPDPEPPRHLLFSATGFVARLPISMVSLGIVLLVSGGHRLLRAGRLGVRGVHDRQRRPRRGPGPAARPARPGARAGPDRRRLRDVADLADVVGPGRLAAGRVPTSPRRSPARPCRPSARASGRAGRTCSRSPTSCRRRSRSRRCGTRRSSCSGRSWSPCWPPPGTRWRA